MLYVDVLLLFLLMYHIWFMAGNQYRQFVCVTHKIELMGALFQYTWGSSRQLNPILRKSHRRLQGEASKVTFAFH